MRIKVLFSLMIVIILLVISFASFFPIIEDINVFSRVSENISLGRVVSSVYELDPVSYKCESIQTPENAIILRVDDIGKNAVYDVSKKLVDEILARGFKITLGIIPYNIESNFKVFVWLRELRLNENVEIALHGYKHDPEEFKEFSYEEALTSIRLGERVLEEDLGVRAITFIPPYNIYSSETLDALKDYGYKILSSGRNEAYVEEDFVALGYAARTFDFQELKLVSAQETLNDCRRSLEANNACVVMIHPQDYTGSDWNELGSDEYAEFIELLDGLEVLSQQMNASFETFNSALCALDN